MVMVYLIAKPCKLGVIEVMHSYREDNGCADKLANLGFQMDVGFRLLDIMPTVVSFQLRADAQGVLYPRLLYSISN
ncbi:hypothetical protein RHMOL_Rhmol10G0122500 [Rhododendron molle]|uniref:Uncharacterized protein n=1 Tax=Rhododendron molle TaxID=49168 RepID=A0ACC0M2F0_RHOML|nr:hypothetical protein RHMOL_Rhmol10G0122500 [Rhododendron molle]